MHDLVKGTIQAKVRLIRLFRMYMRTCINTIVNILMRLICLIRK